MRCKRPRALLALLPALTGLACQQPKETSTINTPPTDPAESRRALAEYFAYHQDQGYMHSRSIADIHFVPGSTHLSGTGEAALARYAELLAESGGTLNYDTRLRDEVMVNGRLDEARRFLLRYNVGGPQIQVALGMPGGRGMEHIESAGGQAVAKQPEPRGTAYHISNVGSTGGGSN